MQGFRKISKREILEMIKGKELYDFDIFSYLVSKEDLSNQMCTIPHTYSFFEEEISINSNSVFISNEDSFLAQVIEEVYEGSCVGISPLAILEQGEIYRFIQGDPLVFSAKVEGIYQIEKGNSFVVLKCLNGDLFFTQIYQESLSRIGLSENQEDLPEIQ
ncbi:MAG: hypothetical protein KC516_02070 [Nanoarchaeota archaeon]|nr:hypothetical protein [Nanoarchaeota archaeon]